MWLLAEVVGQYSNPPHPTAMWMATLFHLFASLATVPYFLFWIWMLVHCFRTEPDRQFWIWILIIAQPIGSLAYFVLRYLPSKEVRAPAFLRRWTRGRELVRLETAAEQIGNAHQFVQWADALREVGQLDQSKDAYERALNKDSSSLPALWGAAQVASKQRRFADCRSLTRRVLDKDPQYKFGDVSLVHGRALTELGERENARIHFEQHVRRWRHPEAMYVLAKLCVEGGDSKAARQHLLAMIQDINGSPMSIARKFGRWKSRARQLLRKIPSA